MKNIYKKWLVNVTVYTCSIIILLSSLVYITTTNNPLYLRGQKRIIEAKANSASVVFVGDSSLGRGLDAKLFSNLIGEKFVLNLSTSAGPHNLASTYNMIRHVIENNKNIKLIVIMQAPAIWNEGFVLGGYYSTLGDLDSMAPIKNGFLKKIDFLNFHFLNLRSIYDYVVMKEEVGKNKNEKTFKNGKLILTAKLDEHNDLNYIHPLKSAELKMIDDYVSNKGVMVVWVQGPFHRDVYNNHCKVIDQQHVILRNNLHYIQFIERFLYPVNSNMGNTVYHVDSSYKAESTRFYYNILEPYINVAFNCSKK